MNAKNAAAICLALCLWVGSSTGSALAEPFQILNTYGGGSQFFINMSTLIVDGSKLYGTASALGAQGAIYSLDTNGSNFQVLHSFTDSAPVGNLVRLGSALYGANGGVYKINTNGTGYQNIHTFAPVFISDDFRTPAPIIGLSYANGNSLIGATERDGALTSRIYQLQTDGSGFQYLLQLSSANRMESGGGMTVDADGAIFGTTGQNSNLAFRLSANVLQGLPAPSGTALGVGTPVVSGNKIYGITQVLGSNLNGGVYSMNKDGTGYQLLHTFTGADGSSPSGGLTLVGDNLYGVTSAGGATDGGTVFALKTDGTGFHIMHDFAFGFDDNFDIVAPEGFAPTAALAYSNGVLYGTTAYNIDGFGGGVIFSIVVPEPSSLVLGALGCLALVIAKRRRIAR